MSGRLGSRFTKATQWRVGQRLPQSQLAGRSLGCLVLAKFPEPDGTGGESILGLPGEPDLSERQIVLLESQCGFVATRTNIEALPLPPSLPRADSTAQAPSKLLPRCRGVHLSSHTSSFCFYLTSASTLFNIGVTVNHAVKREAHGNDFGSRKLYRDL